jgi:HSP20 family protein
MAEAVTKLPVKNEKDTTPARASGWGPFESLHKEIDRLFDDFRPLGWRWPSKHSAFDLDLPEIGAGWKITPAFDVTEKEKEYEITAELPGIDEKNVEVKLTNHTLTIKGEKTEEKEEKEKDYYLSERRYGSFHRSFQLPDGVNADKVEASFAKGVLTIKLPKTAEARKAEKKIQVKAA